MMSKCCFALQMQHLDVSTIEIPTVHQQVSQLAVLVSLATSAQWHKRVTLFHEFKSELSPPGRRFMSKTLVGTHIFGIRSPLVVYNGPIVRVVQQKWETAKFDQIWQIGQNFFPSDGNIKTGLHGRSGIPDDA